ncbi:MAG: zinc-ribbon domain-containing protein [Acidobacteriaceae bacterium]
MQCQSCQAENAAGAAFCQNCGAPLGASTPGAPYEAPQPGVPPAAGATGSYGQAPVMQGGLSDSAAGAIAYLTIIPAIIFLLVEPYRSRPFVRFHAVQCIGLTIVAAVLRILVSFMSYHLWSLFLVINLVVFIAWLIAIVSAAQGKWFKLPLIGDMAMQQSRR